MPDTTNDAHPVEELLRTEIAAQGSISFDRFMEVALYHPQHGYYCRGRKPIGIAGDFYTASQLQPVFGMLVRQYALRIATENHLDLPRTFFDFGAGRGEMAEAFPDWQYRALEVHTPRPTGPLSGLIFGNELFDAFPVASAIRQGQQVFERRVAWNGERFSWVTAPLPSDAIAAYAERAGVPPDEGFEFEVHSASIRFLEQLLAQAKNALLIFIDYSYNRREWKRFPQGTLMAYRHHRAHSDVLASPGDQDITSHVPYHLLAELAAQAAGRVLRMERLSSALLFAGEADSFSSVLDGVGDRVAFERRQQLKTLLYGLGESFSVIAIAK
jgi:SAM-dependent MidA family methyltransferase